MMRFFLCFQQILAIAIGILAEIVPIATAGSQALNVARPSTEPFAQGVVTVSGDSVERLRMAQLEGRAAPGGLMLRSTSTLMDPRRAGARPSRFTVVLPTVNLVYNSKLPYGQNDGALWSGIGANARVLAGFTASLGPLRLVAIPELVYSANDSLSLNPDDTRFTMPLHLRRARNRFSMSWNQFPYSIDLPWKFGDAPVRRLYPGQSSVTLSGGPVEVGFGTENEWWGPALRNPIIMSDNAPGMPHGFLRTSRPLDTRLGLWEARWIVGVLQESNWWTKFTEEDDLRSLSAIAVTWQHSAESGLTLGFLRSVFSVASSYGDVAGNLFDFIKNTGHPNARAVTDGTMEPGKDQLFSLFARWALPAYGFESYVEWGRAELPVSLHDFLDMPNHTRGYTAGLQWVRPVGTDSHVRLQGEVTNVEQSSTWQYRPIGSFYTSRSVYQGYTNSGQMIGSGIGPGSSGQWIAADYYKAAWQFGGELSRTRFNNDAYYLLPFPAAYVQNCAHDVSFYPGIRAAYSGRQFRVRANFSPGTRYNTFFQNRESCFDGAGSDRTNNNLSVTLSTFGW
ncbi:MAG TPA: capsule assembly Wzi family protein [Gemmatimonadaceae bacterium]|nr:capsule assembly Wzi family protein [Gemmatimonadaceae bacterium]